MHPIRVAYFAERTITPSDVVDLYTHWRDDPEYLCLRERHNYEMGIYQGHVFSCNVYHFVKAAKRGNDVYQARIAARFAPLRDLPPVKMFDIAWGDSQTYALFVTLTFDPSLMTSDEAWMAIGDQWHLFTSKLTQAYGPIAYIRTWESTQNYYPHIHALILFTNHVFDAFEHMGQDGVQRFRISRKDRNKIASFWHSHVDVQAIDDTGKAMTEVIKYITKDAYGPKGNKTNAMCWLHMKQQYSISRKFPLLLGSQVQGQELAPPGMDDLISAIMHNCNSDYEFIGIFRGQDLRFSGDIWYAKTSKPPPHVMDLIFSELARREGFNYH